MKKYRVNVNGTAYEVEIELIDSAEAAAAERQMRAGKAIVQSIHQDIRRR